MRIGIIGAGITGLTLGYELAKKKNKVTIFEKDQAAGGLAAGLPFNNKSDLYLDLFYHHIFNTDHEILSLLDELGLKDDLWWLPSKSGLIAHQKLWPFGGPKDLLTFKPLGSIFQRLLMGLNILYFKRSTEWRHLDSITCEQFFKKRFNHQGYTALWEPLLKQKFSDSFNEIPAAFLWGRIHPRSQSRQEGKETLGYLKGSFQILVNKLVSSIRQLEGSVLLHSPVTKVTCGKQPEIVVGEKTCQFDKVIWTGPGSTLASLARLGDCADAKQSAPIQYIQATCLIMYLKKKLSDYYWLNNLDSHLSFGAIIEHTNLVSPQHYDNNHIVYLVNYHKKNHPVATIDKTSLLDYHTPSLKTLFPHFDKTDVLNTILSRAAFSSPLYDLNFSKKIPGYSFAEGIDMCGMTQVYPEDRNMNNCAKNAIRYLQQSKFI